MSSLRPALVLLLAFTAITGLLYPLGVTGIAQVLAPEAAGGSLARRDGAVVGSRLVGQHFASPRYFHGRHSATTGVDPADPAKTVDQPYNAASSTGSNLAPSSRLLLTQVETRARALGPGPQPADLVTASASGLDPHISPAAARVQIARVAEARSLPDARVRDLVEALVEGRVLGVLGEPVVNVLALNMALDALRP